MAIREMDIRLKDILGCINTYQKIVLNNRDNGETFYPTYAQVQNYQDYYVTEIESGKFERLSISIKESI